MQTQQDIGPHLEELTKALGNKVGTEVTEEDIRDEFAKYLEYGVPPDQAKRTILRSHGVQSTAAGAPASTPTTNDRIPIAQLPPSSPHVVLRGRFITLNTKEVVARGESKEIFWGLLGDETGTISYTSWRPLTGLAKDDEVEIKGAYTKEWNGQAQLNIGDRTQISKLELGEVGKTPTAWNEVSVGDIRDGMRGVVTEGRIMTITPREITLKSGEAKTLWGGKLADDSGSIEFTSWHDHGLQEGQAVRIEGAYVRSFRGVPQLNFDADATITEPKATIPEGDALATSLTIGLGDLLKRGGGSDIAIEATLLEVRPGSGLIFRDPETNRVVSRAQNPEATPDLRVKAILDDGTGCVNAIIGRPLTEKLLGKDLAACEQEAQAAFGGEVIQNQLEEKLTGRNYRVIGNALSDEFGMMVIVQSIEPLHVEAKEEAAKLLDAWEAQ